MDMIIMDKVWLTEKKLKAEKRIKELHHELKRATIERSIEITKLLSNLELTCKSLEQRLNNYAPSVGQEYSVRL